MLKFKRLPRILLCGSLALLLGACPSVPPVPEPPNVQVLEYRKTFAMRRDPISGTFRSNVAGLRCYSTNTTSPTHIFKFDDSRDSITLTVDDNAGVRPGSSFAYVLYQEVNGSVAQSWQFVTDNTSGTSFKHTFQYEFSIANGRLRQGQEAGGIYRINTTSRDVSMTLAFDLADDVAFKIACATYD